MERCKDEGEQMLCRPGCRYVIYNLQINLMINIIRCNNGPQRTLSKDVERVLIGM
jgi:hypothetical protein